MSYPSGRHFLQIPGPTNVPEQVLRAMAKPTIDHRGPEFKALALVRRAQAGFQDGRTGRHLCLFGNGRLGGGAGQHALSRRQGADVRDGSLRDPLEEHGCPAGAGGRFRPRRLAARRRSRRRRSQAGRGQGSSDQVGHGRPQRDLDSVFIKKKKASLEEIE